MLILFALAGIVPLGPCDARPSLGSRPVVAAFPFRPAFARAPRPTAITERPAAASEEEEACPTEEASTLQLIGFIVPTLAGWLSSEVMSIVDTAVVGSSSAAELAALGPATMLTDSSSYLFFWLNVATTNLFASSLAEGKPKEAYRMLSDALYVAIACGVLLAACLATGGTAALRGICWQAPMVLPAAQRYLSIRLFGLPAFMAGTVLQAACLAAKDSTSPLLVLMFAGSLNLCLDLWLVRGVGMGIGGAAIATLASQLVQVALLAWVVQRKRRRTGVALGWSLVGAPPSPSRLLSFLSFAGPIFLVLLGKISCYNSMTLAATSGGVVALAAHQVMASIFFFGCKFGDAVSQTAQAFLPPCLGDADISRGEVTPSAQRLGRRLLALSTMLGGFVSLAIYSFITRCSGVFTSDIAVTAAIHSASPLLLLALLAHASCMCSEGLLLGGRQLTYLASAYAFNVALFLSGLYMVALRSMGLNAVWTSLAVFQYVRLTQFLSRARQLGMLRAAKTPNTSTG